MGNCGPGVEHCYFPQAAYWRWPSKGRPEGAGLLSLGTACRFDIAWQQQYTGVFWCASVDGTTLFVDAHVHSSIRP